MRAPKSRGFTLMELMVAVAITGVIVSMAYWGGKNVVPSAQTRSFAAQLKADLDRCRLIAINAGNYCRIKVKAWDGDLGGAINNGAYWIQFCNETGVYSYDNGDCWDLLPIDQPDAEVGSNQSEGEIDVALDAKWVSISGFGGASTADTLDWPDDDNEDSIVFDPRGRVINPASQYTQEGAIFIDVANKFLFEDEGRIECYSVQIGLAQGNSGTTRIRRLDAACPSFD